MKLHFSKSSMLWGAGNVRMANAVVTAVGTNLRSDRTRHDRSGRTIQSGRLDESRVKRNGGWTGFESPARTVGTNQQKLMWMPVGRIDVRTSTAFRVQKSFDVRIFGQRIDGDHRLLTLRYGAAAFALFIQIGWRTVQYLISFETMSWRRIRCFDLLNQQTLVCQVRNVRLVSLTLAKTDNKNGHHGQQHGKRQQRYPNDRRAFVRLLIWRLLAVKTTKEKNH